MNLYDPPDMHCTHKSHHTERYEGHDFIICDHCGQELPISKEQCKKCNEQIAVRV